MDVGFTPFRFLEFSYWLLVGNNEIHYMGVICSLPQLTSDKANRCRRGVLVISFPVDNQYVRFGCRVLGFSDLGASIGLGRGLASSRMHVDISRCNPDRVQMGIPVIPV